MFTAAIDGGQWGSCIVVPCDHHLQFNHVDAGYWELRRFDSDCIFRRPLNAFRTAKECAGRAVTVVLVHGQGAVPSWI